VNVTVSADGLGEWFETFRIVQAASIWSNHGDWITRTRPRFGPGIKERFEWAARLDPGAVAAAQDRHREIRARLDAVIGADDVLCLPTSPRVAPLKHTPVDDIEVRFRHQAMHLLCIAGLGGLPQVSLPLAELDGLPLGLSLVGPRGSDFRLLALTRALGPGPAAGRDAGVEPPPTRLAG
jgi:amidase